MFIFNRSIFRLIAFFHFSKYLNDIRSAHCYVFSSGFLLSSYKRVSRCVYDKFTPFLTSEHYLYSLAIEGSLIQYNYSTIYSFCFLNLEFYYCRSDCLQLFYFVKIFQMFADAKPTYKTSNYCSLHEK